MDRFRLSAAVLLLACAPVRGLCGAARIADVRVGQHGDYERIVVELQAEGEVGVHWVGDDSGAEIFEIAARPLLARQLFTTGRPHVGEMLLLAAQGGAELRLEPQPRRTRAFLLSGPPRLVIDIAAPGAGAFDAPGDVHAILRERSEPEPVAGAPAAAAPPQTAAVSEQAADEASDPVPAAPALEEPAAEPEDASTEAEPEAPRVTPRTWLQSRALVVPVLAGIGVLLLAAGGLALASAQRSRPLGRRRSESDPTLASGSLRALKGLPDPALFADRLDLLEKRLDEEVCARMQLAEQLAAVREELGGMRELFSRLRAQAAARSAAPSAPQ